MNCENVKYPVEVLRQHKKYLGLRGRLRYSKISRLRTETILNAYGADIPQRWFWKRWFLIAFCALEKHSDR